MCICNVGPTWRSVSPLLVFYRWTEFIFGFRSSPVGLSVHFIETKVTFEKNKAVVMMDERIGKTPYHLSILPKLSEVQQQTDTALFSAPPSTTIDVWHQRLAHVSYKTILKMSSEQLVEGLQLPANKSIPKQPCLGCVFGKMQRSSFPVGSERANKVGQLINSDVCGPMHVSTPSGAKFFAPPLMTSVDGEQFIYWSKNHK